MKLLLVTVLCAVLLLQVDCKQQSPQRKVFVNGTPIDVVPLLNTMENGTFGYIFQIPHEMLVPNTTDANFSGGSHSLIFTEEGKKEEGGSRNLKRRSLSLGSPGSVSEPSEQVVADLTLVPKPLDKEGLQKLMELVSKHAHVENIGLPGQPIKKIVDFLSQSVKDKLAD